MHCGKKLDIRSYFGYMYSLIWYVKTILPKRLFITVFIEKYQNKSFSFQCVFDTLFSLNWPSGPIQSISRYVCLSVCLSVCLYVPSCEVPFKRLFASIYKGPR